VFTAVPLLENRSILQIIAAQVNAARTRTLFNHLTPNDYYSGRTAPLTSKRFILYIYSTNKGTEYFKRGIHSPFFSVQNAVSFTILTYLVHVLFTFYIQDVLKLKKNNSGAKRLTGLPMYKSVMTKKQILRKRLRTTSTVNNNTLLISA